MEIITIILSVLLSAFSPVGVLFDSAAQNAIRSQLYAADRLEVRIDNTPSYQLLQGKIDRLRFAGRGLYLTPDIRIDTLEFETDPIDVDLERLNEEDKTAVPQFLRQPLQGAVRLVLTEADMNQTLQSAIVAQQIRQFQDEVAQGNEAEAVAQRFEIINPKVEFLNNNQLRFEMDIEDQRDNNRLKVTVESGIRTVTGHQLQLVEPKVQFNEEDAPPRLVEAIAKFVNRKLDLKSFEPLGLQARILQFNITQDQLELSAFMRIQNSALISGFNDFTQSRGVIP